MNVQQGKWSSDALEVETLDDAALARRRKRRNIILAAAVVLVALVAAVLVFGSGKSGDDPAAAAKAGEAAGGAGGQTPRVSVIVPGRQQVVRTISATGTLAARRDMPVGVAGEGGKVVRVLVEPGQWVGAGQTLAVIERAVQTQEARQLAASIEVARADARLAQQELDRAQSLVGRGFISKADVERRIATRDAANARVRVAQAQLGAAQARIGRLDVRAPAAGLILGRNVEAGQVVSSGSGALFRMAQGGEMELLARLSQEDLSGITPGIPATVTPVGSSQSFQGRVWQVSPIIDPQTRQGNARIAVPYHQMLRPGGFASAMIRAGAVDAPLLPESAVQSDDKGNFVYLIDQNNAVVRRDVTTGEVSDQGVAIMSGLNGNERVVQSAGAFLNPGQKVQPVRATAR
ncbi:efflux RND transporter periplasmic adaptor subunit [Allosphingosinicella deserti]|uniref:Efflux RND transporter periplasmic adaptor subunit n=1 Tax=Allosphingosinicella deserti TaxID=2116704 RepID=A0A2P7QIA1_9SPHN|nr:efflux RND transporter periplasmic adaptor subunit [Sphingomonas deserti]